MSVRGRIYTIAELQKAASKFTIPSYQRMYRWKESVAQELVLDIAKAMDKPSYRLGQIVLLEEKDGHLSILDGSQRLITIALLCKALSLEFSFSAESDYDEVARHRIRANYHQICRTLFLVEDKNRFIDYFLNHVDVVVFQTSNMEEAFYYYDSSDSRGRALNPFDLLKAYHLCAMRKEGETALWSVTEKWESIGPDALSELFQLWYPLRCWYEHRPERFFSYDEISYFKGCEDNAPFPFILSISSSYQLCQRCINGQPFFQMVFHYSDKLQTLKAKLDLLYPDLIQRNFPEKEMDTGLSLSFSFFLSLLFLYYDRFGDYQLRLAIQVLFRYCFALYLQDKSVTLKRINEHILMEDSIFYPLSYSSDPYNVISYDLDRYLGSMRNLTTVKRSRPIDFIEDFPAFKEACHE